MGTLQIEINTNQTESNAGFCGEEKTGVPGENLSGRRREPTNCEKDFLLESYWYIKAKVWSKTLLKYGLNVREADLHGI